MTVAPLLEAASDDQTCSTRTREFVLRVSDATTTPPSDDGDRSTDSTEPFDVQEDGAQHPPDERLPHIAWEADCLRLLDSGDLYYAFWLWDNRTKNYTGTGQKVETRLNQEVQIADAVVTNCNTGVRVTFTNGENSFVTFEFLRRYGATRLSNSVRVSSATTEIPEVSFTSMGDSALIERVMEHVVDDGICLVKGFPAGKEAIEQFAEPLGGLLDNMYSRIWTLMFTADGSDASGRKNAAYTRDRLKLHQDLVYFEASPGLQMLSWQRNDAGIVGGMSTFVETTHVLNRFREEHPKEFELLCRVPATFQKDCMDRSPPAQYFYREPHIRTNDEGDIINLAWAPPFEGPLIAGEHYSKDDVMGYYKARALLEKAFETAPTMIQRRMDTGDFVIWNNKRMLHGRTEIGGEGQRMAFGAYINLDMFLTSVRSHFRQREMDNPNANPSSPKANPDSPKAHPFLRHQFHNCY